MAAGAHGHNGFRGPGSPRATGARADSSMAASSFNDSAYQSLALHAPLSQQSLHAHNARSERATAAIPAAVTADGSQLCNSLPNPFKLGPVPVNLPLRPSRWPFDGSETLGPATQPRAQRRLGTRSRETSNASVLVPQSTSTTVVTPGDAGAARGAAARRDNGGDLFLSTGSSGVLNRSMDKSPDPRQRGHRWRQPALGMSPGSRGPSGNVDEQVGGRPQPRAQLQTAFDGVSSRRSIDAAVMGRDATPAQRGFRPEITASAFDEGPSASPSRSFLGSGDDQTPSWGAAGMPSGEDWLGSLARQSSADAHLQQFAVDAPSSASSGRRDSMRQLRATAPAAAPPPARPPLPPAPATQLASAFGDDGGDGGAPRESHSRSGTGGHSVSHRHGGISDGAGPRFDGGNESDTGSVYAVRASQLVAAMQGSLSHRGSLHEQSISGGGGGGTGWNSPATSAALPRVPHLGGAFGEDDGGAFGSEEVPHELETNISYDPDANGSGPAHKWSPSGTTGPGPPDTLASAAIQSAAPRPFTMAFGAAGTPAGASPLRPQHDDTGARAGGQNVAAPRAAALAGAFGGDSDDGSDGMGPAFSGRPPSGEWGGGGSQGGDPAVLPTLGGAFGDDSDDDAGPAFAFGGGQGPERDNGAFGSARSSGRASSADGGGDPTFQDIVAQVRDEVRRPRRRRRTRRCCRRRAQPLTRRRAGNKACVPAAAACGASRAAAAAHCLWRPAAVDGVA